MLGLYKKQSKDKQTKLDNFVFQGLLDLEKSFFPYALLTFRPSSLSGGLHFRAPLHRQSGSVCRTGKLVSCNSLHPPPGKGVK
eukprot:2335536-Amphidinium_carterae.1